MKRVKIEIVDSSTDESESIEFECDNFSISEEQGHQEIFDGPCCYRFAPEIRSNGHHRLTLKTWRGCSEFEDFVSKEKIYLRDDQVVLRRHGR